MIFHFSMKFSHLIQIIEIILYIFPWATEQEKHLYISHTKD